MEAALKANETALQCLLMSKEEDAVHVLRESLKAVLHLFESSVGGVPQDGRSQESTELCAIRHVSVKDIVCNDSNVFSIYGNAFTLETAVVLENQENPSIREQVAAILLFNLGLSYHLLGMKKPPGGYQIHHRACCIYDMSLRVVNSNNFGLYGKLLELAIFNNKCHIHSASFQFARTDECIRHTGRIMTEITQEYGYVPIEFVHFHLNLIVTADGGLKASPAA